MTMPAPRVVTATVTKSTISDEVGMNKTNINFTFDQDVTEYTVNVIGTSHDTGSVADSGKKNIATMKTQTVGQLKTQTVRSARAFTQGTTLTAEVSDGELYSEGDNQINIYGKAIDGTWTPYMDSR